MLGRYSRGHLALRRMLSRANGLRCIRFLSSEWDLDRDISLWDIEDLMHNAIDKEYASLEDLKVKVALPVDGESLEKEVTIALSENAEVELSALELKVTRKIGRILTREERWMLYGICYDKLLNSGHKLTKKVNDEIKQKEEPNEASDRAARLEVLKSKLKSTADEAVSQAVDPVLSEEEAGSSFVPYFGTKLHWFLEQYPHGVREEVFASEWLKKFNFTIPIAQNRLASDLINRFQFICRIETDDDGKRIYFHRPNVNMNTQEVMMQIITHPMKTIRKLLTNSSDPGIRLSQLQDAFFRENGHFFPIFHLREWLRRQGVQMKPCEEDGVDFWLLKEGRKPKSASKGVPHFIELWEVLREGGDMNEAEIFTAFRQKFGRELHMPNFFKRSLRPFLLTLPSLGQEKPVFRAKDAREIETCGIHAGNLPAGCSREEEKIFFRQFGPIDYIFRPRAQECVVFYSNAGGAQRVMEESRLQIRGKSFKVQQYQIPLLELSSDTMDAPAGLHESRARDVHIEDKQRSQNKEYYGVDQPLKHQLAGLSVPSFPSPNSESPHPTSSLSRLSEEKQQFSGMPMRSNHIPEGVSRPMWNSQQIQYPHAHNSEVVSIEFDIPSGLPREAQEMSIKSQRKAKKKLSRALGSVLSQGPLSLPEVASRLFELNVIPDSVRNNSQLGAYLVDRHYLDLRYIRPAVEPADDQLVKLCSRFYIPQSIPPPFSSEIYNLPPGSRLEMYERDTKIVFGKNRKPIRLSEFPDLFYEYHGYVPNVFALTFLFQRLGAAIFPTSEMCDSVVRL